MGALQKYNGQGIYDGKVSVSKKPCEGFFPEVFHNSLRPIPNLTTCPSSPAAREPISVVIFSDHPSKKGAMMQKANVSQGKTKMDKMVRGESYPAFVV
jgi:hypothetical protein